jgi:hypothetical protein
MTDLTSLEASEVAAHKAKSAQAAVEVAREVQLAEAIEKTAAQTKQALLEGLKEVFGEGDEKRDPDQMQILIRRIPLICQDVKQIHTDMKDIKQDVGKINDSIGKVVWIILAAVLAAVMKVILIP